MSGRLPSVRKNYIFNLLYEIFATITPFITAPYVSRVLGADEIGKYSYTSSIMTYFTLFAALGTTTYGAREISRYRDNKAKASKVFWEIEIVTVITSLLCLIIWTGLVLISDEYKAYYFALTPMLLSTMFDISWFFVGYERMGSIILRNFVVRILGIVLIFTFVKSKSDIIIYILINSLTNLFGNLSMWLYLPKLLDKVNIKGIKLFIHFKETLIYFVPTIATSVYAVFDKTLIGIITKDSFANGYYEQANKIINILKTVVFFSINQVMGSRLSYLFEKNEFLEIKRRIDKTLNYILFLAFGCIFGVIGVANRFVPLFFGGGYEPVVGLLCLMSPLVVIIGISNCMGSLYYTPNGLRSKTANYIIIGSVANLMCNCLLIPILGAKGAVIGSIVAESIITILYINNSSGYMSWGKIIRFSWKRILAGIIMCYLINVEGNYFNGNSLIVLVTQVISGVLIYIGILVIMQDSIIMETLEEIKAFLKNKCR